MLDFIQTMVGKMVRTAASRKMALSVAAAAGVVGTAPLAASAHDREVVVVEPTVRCAPEARRWVPPVCEERGVTVWVDATYRTVSDDVYIKPVYRTICDRRWVEPVYRTECVRVLVPEVCEIREVVHYDSTGRRYCTRERVVICAAHYENQERRICVCDGHFENVERQECVAQGHYQRSQRQELVTPGHYETRTQRIEVVPGHWEAYASAGWEVRNR